MQIVDLEQQLNSFDINTRKSALTELAELVQTGKITLPHPKPEVNIHFHTFFSFNAESWSPSRIVWEAAKYGLEVAGMVDFDVLDGVEEFLDAGELLGIKTTAGFESRVYVSEYSDKVINSPKEPGILYFMGQGCIKNGSENPSFGGLRKMARDRNIGVIERINAYLGDVSLDYDRDVLPLTPSGNATERHLLAAYDRKAREVHGDNTAKFWAGALEMPEAEVSTLMENTPALHEKLRAKLIKFGGVGYVQPETSSFPAVEQVIEMVKSLGALPTTAWLDGMNPGEADMMANLEIMASKGVVAINIIPDRNWNIKKPEEKALKLAKLKEVVDAAKHFDLPLSVGTEMNKAGLPFVDNFAAPELADYVEDFVKGAQFFYGHTLLARCADFGYFSPAADAAFGKDRRAKNQFFAKIGSSAKPSPSLYESLRKHAGKLSPEEALWLVSR
ncbi:MAG: hypothetical protein ABFD64_08115 [Armatimonadota bacterium]